MGLVTVGCATTNAVVQPPQAVSGSEHMVATSNASASSAALEVLRAGGSAVDAAIAAQLVLTVTEPDASGLGGGALLVYYDPATKGVTVFDGREVAPRGASPVILRDARGRRVPRLSVVASGRSVAVPGVLRMLELAHQRHGRLPWARLFQPAIALADGGFRVTARLYSQLAVTPHVDLYAEARALFFHDGLPRPVGSELTHPKLAETLRTLATEGARAFYEGPIARDVVAAVSSTRPLKGALSEDDLRSYAAVEREALCGQYHGRRICGSPPPSLGTVTLLEALGILEHFDLGSGAGWTLARAHLLAEALRLAFADGRTYVADPAFAPTRVEGLLLPDYLAARAKLVDPTRATRKRARPGRPASTVSTLSATPDVHEDPYDGPPSTSHLVIRDRTGAVVSMTSSLGGHFGSRLMVRGFFLNNHVTYFSPEPMLRGQLRGNRLEPGKRPRTAMTPLIVLDAEGRVELALGSAGSAQIVPHVAKVLMGVLDWGLDVQSAIELPNVVNTNGPTRVEVVPGSQRACERLAERLRRRGHRIGPLLRDSGIQAIHMTPTGLEGGADSRRGGLVLAD